MVAPVKSPSVTSDSRACFATVIRTCSSRSCISCALACEKSSSRICLPLCSMKWIRSSIVGTEWFSLWSSVVKTFLHDRATPEEHREQLPQQRLHDVVHRVERRVQRGHIFSARFGQVRTPAAFAANFLRHRTHHFPRLNAA